jgi:protein-disulfide isomerase
LSRIPISVLSGLVAVSLALGAKAQLPGQDRPDAAADRRIELTVRSQFNVPAGYDLTVGPRKPSDISGYDTVPITLKHGPKSTEINFLLSKDGKTLARLETFDLAEDQASRIDTAGRPIRGNPSAKVTVINFDDLECPFCARMHQTLFPSTFERYKDKVRFIYKDNPLSNHPWAMHAAVDANCLASQSGDAYWKYVDYLHTHPDEISGEKLDLKKSIEALDRIARLEGTADKLDDAKLNACLAKQDETLVRISMKEAGALGFDATPSLFIAGEKVIGALPAEDLWAVIDRALKAEGEQPPPAAPQVQSQKGGSK